MTERTFDKIAQEAAQEACDHLLVRIYEQILEDAAGCESEIERAFVAGLHCAAKAWTGPMVGALDPHFQGPPTTTPTIDPQCAGLAVYPQAPIDQYRVDFLILAYGRLSIVVECDGHDFHERTREQAERDRRRDRHLTSAGYIVLRFTGRELWRNPTECAEQVLQLIEDRLLEIVRARRAAA